MQHDVVSTLRSLGRIAWWCAGAAPFAGTSILLCLMAPEVEPEPASWWFAGLGLAGVAITLLACWQWSRPARRGLAELPRCLLLAVPLSFVPALLAREATRTTRFTSLELLVVPQAIGVLTSVYLACVVVVWLIRQPPSEGEPGAR